MTPEEVRFGAVPWVCPGFWVLTVAGTVLRTGRTLHWPVIEEHNQAFCASTGLHELTEVNLMRPITLAKQCGAGLVAATIHDDVTPNYHRVTGESPRIVLTYRDEVWDDPL